MYTQQLEYCPIGEAGDVTLENGITCQVRPVANQDIPMLVNAENAALEAEGYQVYTLKSEMYYERLMKEYASEDAKLMLYYLNGHLVGNCPYVPEQEEEKREIMSRSTDARRMLSSVSLRELTSMLSDYGSDH